MNTSHWKAYIAFAAGHFLLTVFAGVFIPAWGVALADSGVTVAPWSFVAFELIGVAVSLPLVLPLTLMGFIRSWTDSGEVILVFAALANVSRVAHSSGVCLCANS